jgi:hypothetical protein
MNKFDKIILYYICDFLYDEFKFALTPIGKSSRGLGYQTFRNMCKSLSDKIIFTLPFSKLDNLILNKVLGRLSIFFGLTDDESANYMYDFLHGKIWEKSYESVSLINTVFSTSKNI